jgi:hypothetical protein
MTIALITAVISALMGTLGGFLSGSRLQRDKPVEIIASSSFSSMSLRAVRRSPRTGLLSGKRDPSPRCRYIPSPPN